MNIRSGSYKNIEAVILENDVLQTAVIPKYGSKIASLIYKPLSYESLWQNPEQQYRETGFGAAYPDGEFSGFDEMFPTISRCFYEDAPWEGIEAPDHGEVWSIPWLSVLQADSLKMSVHGVRFPYRIEKEVSLDGGSLKIKYHLENLSSAEFRYIWAAHPLFNTCPGMEIILPEGMDKIINAVPGSRLGGYGRELPFPIYINPAGESLDLSMVPDKNPTGYQKYYFAGKVPEGWCSLVNPENSLKITLQYPREEIPYLGVWLNEGGWADQYNIALEPASAAMDRIDFSQMWGMGCSIEPYATKSWYLSIEFSEQK